MSRRFSSLASLGFLSVILLSATDACAMKDKDNQGRWTKPTRDDLPDREVPGFLINLGPTGARAILTDKTFIVRYIFKDSPAVKGLKLDDVITGAFGKPFGTHTFGGGSHGYEGPIMDLGLAIEKAEGADGKLVLNVQRGSEKIDVTIDLEPIGTFSATFPVGCKKSEVVRAKALKYLTEHPDALNVGSSHARMAVALALLTSDEPKQFAAGKAIVLRWNGQKPDAGTWSWDLSHQLITLSEYHLMTKDASVLATMKLLVAAIEKAQWTAPIPRWKSEEGLSYGAILDQHKTLYDGGFGHCPFTEVVARGGGGYGPMQYTTILTVIARQEAGQCGVNPNPDSIKRSVDFIHRGTNAAGYVGYGGEFTIVGGGLADMVDSAAWKKSKGGDNYAGRAGCSIIAHKLSPEFSDSIDYADLNQRFLGRAYKSMPDGHADSNLGILWGIMGAAASGDEKVLRTVLDYHKAFFNMMRCFDGSFVLLPGRDYADDGYYTASRYHPTGTMALAYGLSHPKLMIQGIQVSLPGINPKTLKGRMDTAYRALVKRNYAEAAAALKDAGSDDATVAATMQAHLETQAQQSVTLLEAVEKTGDIERLKTDLTKAQAQFGLLPAFKEKAARFEEGFRQDAWILELKLAAEYRRLVEALQRNKSAAYAGDLERFGGKYPDSLYGRWALEVAKEYQASGTIKNPSVAIATAPAASGTKPLAALSAPGGVAATTPVANGGTPTVTAPPAARPRMAVSPEVLAQWQSRFVKKLDALAKGGAKLKVDLGDNQNYVLRGANEASLIVSAQGSELPMPWRLLSPTYRAALAKGAATDDDAEALLIAGVMQLACDRKEQAEELFAKAAMKDAEAVKVTKAALGK